MSDQIQMPANPTSGVQPRVVLDTDTYNEIDDQFALAYLLRSPDRADCEAIYAAPFLNDRSTSAGDGMEKSYEEIGRLLERLGVTDMPVLRGSDQFLSETGDSRPVGSDAASDLVERALTATHSDRLHIIAIGALTNIASALLAEPSITERCTLVWLGSHHPTWPDNKEFNACGDVDATRVVFDSSIPMYVVPCFPVASHLHTTAHELAACMDLDDPLCRFLYDRFTEYGPGDPVWTKQIWDIAAVAWVVLPGSVESYCVPTPRIARDGSHILDPRRDPCRYAFRLDRDAIFTDMYARLSPR